jgi:hypothetical protein
MTASGKLWWLTALAVCLALVAPFFAVDVPPVLDYPNHLARLYVLAFGASDPVLRTMYAPHWQIVPNLAIDLIGPPLMQVMPVSVVGRLLLALSAIVPVGGVVLYHRAAFGRWSLWPLAAGLVAYNGAFLLGFMNFLYSVGLAFAVAAVWIQLSQRRLAAAVGAAALGNLALFFCHLLGVLFFMLLIAAHELAEVVAARAAGQPVGRRILVRAGALLLALAPVAALYQVSAMADATGPTVWDIPIRRVFHLLVPFATYDATLTWVSAVVVVEAIVLIRRHLRFDAGSAVAFCALGIAYLFAPAQMKSGAVIDLRLPVMMGFLLFAGIEPVLSRKVGTVLAAALGVLLVARTACVVSVWFDHRHDLAELRATYASVEAGAKVMAVTATKTASPDYRAHEPRGRELPFLFRTDEHLPALMLIERHAFWPLLFADPHQQPLAVLPPYDQLADPLGEPQDYHLLADADPARKYRGVPAYLGRLDDFDYVLLLNAGATESSGPWAARLDLVKRTDVAALYRVRHD